ncbi:MAG: HIT family protein, partial [Pseudomonadota bacterium]
KRAVPTVLDMTDAEWMGCIALLREQVARIDAQHRPDGYNIGINCHAAAGQTIYHAHIHIIPRYWGDHPNPRGGVRAVIPGKADYT